MTERFNSLSASNYREVERWCDGAINAAEIAGRRPVSPTPDNAMVGDIAACLRQMSEALKKLSYQNFNNSNFTDGRIDDVHRAVRANRRAYQSNYRRPGV